MNYVRESYIYQLWLALLSAYETSVLRRVLVAAGAWCNRQIDQSKLMTVLCREGVLARSWESSLLCRGLTAVINLPIRLLQWIYGKLRPLFEESLFAQLAFRMGDETAIAQSWLILLLWIIPYKRWSNAYTMMGFLLLACLFCVRGMHDRQAKLDLRRVGFYPVLFFGAVCAAVPLSAHPSLSARFLMYHAAAALCALLTVSAVRHAQDLKRLVGGASAAADFAGVGQTVGTPEYGGVATPGYGAAMPATPGQMAYPHTGYQAPNPLGIQPGQINPLTGQPYLG